MAGLEYFCTSCKKFVKDIRSSSGFGSDSMMVFAGGDSTVLVHEECGSPVMGFEKQKR